MREQTRSDILGSNHAHTQKGGKEDTVWNLSVQMMEIHVQELLHQAATERLACEARVPMHGWLYRQKCRWLCRLGWFLVGLGQRLQQVGLPLAVAMEERVITERYIGS
jgi:hypothetical protein